MSNDDKTNTNNEGGGGESKGPSKKELKKLAKKAEKDAAKAAAKQGGGGGGSAGGNTGAADKTKAGAAKPTSPPAAATAVTPEFLLANVPSDGASDPCTLKACMASVLFSISLSNGGACADELPFVRGPALLYGPPAGDSSGGGSGPVLAFGGNGILKALALLAERARCNDHGNVESAPVMSAAMDDWLEFERCRLRPAVAAASSGDSKALESALKVVETALESHSGVSVVGGNSPLTAADAAISLTLLHGPTIDDRFLSPALRSYLQLAQTSPAYRRARSLAARLSPPPPPPPLDPTDPSLLHATSSVFATAIHAAFPAALSLLDAKLFESFKCKDIKHGDYQCNAAMPLFQKLKASGALNRPKYSDVKTPQDVAKKIIEAIPEDNPVVEGLTVNGPGFIMSRVKKEFLETWVQDLLVRGAPCKPHLEGKTRRRSPPPSFSSQGEETNEEEEVVVVDFSSPNIAKEMHVGHLRSTIIGESVCRILEYLDRKVLRVNHVGDWGTQFGMLIQYLKEEYPDFQNGDEGMPNITDLTQFYKNAKQRFDENPEFKKISQLNVVKLQAGDPECRRIWQVLCDVSRKEFEKVYDRLDIAVEECGESFYNDKIPPVIEEFETKGLIRVEDGGAKCVFVDKYKVPLMLQKSDGGYGYDSTDMAAIKYRLEELKAKHIVYITDFTQGDHFQMVFAAARKIGWVRDGDDEDDEGAITASSHRLDHIGFGTVQGEDGKRFKTRSGDTVRLVDLLDEAVSRMETSLRERMTEGKANISEEELHATASAMGYGAVKYFDLRRNPTSNYIFSYDRMLDTKGNTAIYLLYAHARLESIIAKGKADFNVDVDELISSKKTKVVLGHKSERNLGLHLQFFADCIEETLKDLYPYHICDFVYALSNAASEFVTQCKVLGSEEMESRLLLCRATTLTMRQCFHLLGIRHVMRI